MFVANKINYHTAGYDDKTKCIYINVLQIDTHFNDN